MSDEHLANYLSDHLAGSVAALQLLEELEKSYRGEPLERFFAELRADVTADRQELESLMSRLGVRKSRARQASAWLSEKAMDLKMRIDDPAGGAFRLFESLEGLSLGIEGKRALWRALATVAGDEPALRSLDYERMIRRAGEQRARVEDARLDAARNALAPAR